MKNVSLAAGAIGVLLVLGAILGRFKGPPEIYFWGSHSAGSFLLLGNTFLLVAILVAVLSVQKKDAKPSAPCCEPPKA